MYADAQKDAPTRVPSPSHPLAGRCRGLTLLLLLLLLIGIVAFLVRSLAGGASPQVAIHWQQVLPQYAVEALVAAPSNPAVLYACAFPSSADQLPTGLLLRSRDAGAHWQVLMTSLGDAATCSIAVNPGNANDLYLSVTGLTTSSPAVLLHSDDGGQTWTTLHATLVLSPHARTIAWQGGRVSVVGHRLFAVQLVQGIAHLIASSDGGQTWTMLDASLTNAPQELLSYVVDSTAPSTIYELVGQVVDGWFSYAPSQGTPPPILSPVPVGQLVRHLYKTVDGGRTWEQILSSVPYGSSLQLAWSHPHMLYLGGLTGQESTSSQRTFSMQVSVDSGDTWQSIALPTNAHLINNWLVDTSDRLYVAADDPNKQPGGVVSIQRYDPSDQQWSTLAGPSIYGGLLAVTATASHSGNLFWFASFEGRLYRGMP